MATSGKTRGQCPGCGGLYTIKLDGTMRKHRNPSGPGDCIGRRPTHKTHCQCSACPAAYFCPEEPSYCGLCEPDGNREDSPAPVIKDSPAPVIKDSPAPVIKDSPAPVIKDDFQDPAAVAAPQRPVQVTPELPDWKALTDSWGSVHDFGSPIPKGEPDSDFDRYGRYILPGGPYTRSSTFAKALTDTYALDQWGNRNVVLGMARRPDLQERAAGRDVKRDASLLNWIAEQAKNEAGHKVKADWGSAYHAFSEYLDADLKTLEDVPEIFRERLREYREEMAGFRLTTRPEWIERTVASTALGAAGTLDRILACPDGEHRVGDLKTGDNAVKYGSLEISVQLASYVIGANENGLYDWKQDRWVPLEKPLATDYAIVMHLPASGKGCTLYRVDLARGMKYAEESRRVQAARKDKQIFSPLQVVDVNPPQTEYERLHRGFSHADSRRELAALYEEARAAGSISPQQLGELTHTGMERMKSRGL